ncbi:MAG TPA: UvrD-helicase domain-containing protein [Caldilineaceae bacterium]|nr:UvrD-helicase domain-containing protein [Caldilineaceae bacterium]
MTPEQRAVAAHNRGPAVVYAVAGAGKTTALVLRAARLAAVVGFLTQYRAQ